MPGPRLACTALAAAESSIADRKPPWTVPWRLVNSSRAVKPMRTSPVPASTPSRRRPSSAPAGVVISICVGNAASGMTGHCMRDIRRLERGDLVGGELQRHGGDRVIELPEPRRADDGRGDAGLLQYPGECDLRARYPAIGGDLRHRLDHLAIGIPGLRVQVAAELVGLLAGARLVPVARQ